MPDDDPDAGPDGDADVEEEDDQPAITEEEQADVDLADLADDVEAATRPDAGEDDQEDVDDTGDDQGDALPAPEGGPAGQWGDMYVGLCTTVTNSIIEEYGGENAERVDKDHFREVDLDYHFNETLQEMGRDTDLPPQQALLVGTMLAVGGPVVMQTDLLAELLEGAP